MVTPLALVMPNLNGAQGSNLGSKVGLVLDNKVVSNNHNPYVNTEVQLATTYEDTAENKHYLNTAGTGWCLVDREEKLVQIET